MLTLAPEWSGSVPFIERVAGEGVTVALGHTDASFDELAASVQAGARLMTHLGNGCPGQLPRHDNIIQRVLALPTLMATLIPDGLHVPPPVLGNLVRTLGPARLAMTTDCMSAAGAPPGRYSLGKLELEVGEDRVVLLPGGSGHFAGSSLRMVDGFYNAIRFGGLDAVGAWRAWTCLRDQMFPGLEAPPLMVPWAGDHAWTPPSRPTAEG